MKAFILLFSFLSIALISGANLIVDEVGMSFESSAPYNSEEYGYNELTIYRAQIDFDLTAEGEDVSVRTGTNKGFLPPTSPDYDLMGFVWQYDSSHLGDLLLNTISESIEFDGDTDENNPFVISDGHTVGVQLTVQFTPVSGRGFTGINLVGGHLANGDFFEIDMSTDRDFIQSAVPEPTSVGLIVIGALACIYCKRKH